MMELGRSARDVHYCNLEQDRVSALPGNFCQLTALQTFLLGLWPQSVGQLTDVHYLDVN
jgi:hypothetical protein